MHGRMLVCRERGELRVDSFGFPIGIPALEGPDPKSHRGETARAPDGAGGGRKAVKFVKFVTRGQEGSVRRRVRRRVWGGYLYIYH